MFSLSLRHQTREECSQLLQDDTAIGSDEPKKTKQEKEKLDKFKYSSKTTSLIYKKDFLNVHYGKDSEEMFHPENFKSVTELA